MKNFTSYSIQKKNLIIYLSLFFLFPLISDNNEMFGMCETPVTTSYCQEFETMTALANPLCGAASNLSECWLNDPSNTADWVAASSHTFVPNLSSNFVILTNYSSGCAASSINYMYSPVFDLSGFSGNPFLQLDYIFYFGGSGISIESSTDGGLSWVPLFDILSDNTNTWQFMQGSLVPFIGLSSVQLRFGSSFLAGQTFSSVALDNICITNCPFPSNLNTIITNPTSATVNWTELGTATSWEIEIVTSGTAPTGSGISVVTNSYMATGLSPETFYDVYVYSDCSGALSEGSTVYKFKTPCVATTALGYCQDFESMILSGPSSVCQNIGTNPLTNCWYNEFNSSSALWGINTGTTSITGTGPNSANGGDNYVFVGNSCGKPATMFSPILDFTSNTTPYLEFYYHMYGANFGSFRVEATIDNGLNWNEIWGISEPQGGNWNRASIDLMAYATENNVQFRFLYFNFGNGSKGDLALDDICIVETPSCTSLSNLSVSNITPTTAEVSWELGNAGAYTINVSIPGNPSASQSFTATASPFTISGLLEGVDYDLSLQAICSPTLISDLIQTSFFTPCSSSIFPICTSFEDLSLGSGYAGLNNPYVLEQCISNSNENTNNWQVIGSPTSSTGTGPNSAFSGDNYIYLESASSGGANTIGILDFPSNDFTGVSGALILDFYYHMYGLNMGSLKVEVSIDGGTNWTNEFIMIGDQGFNWLNANLDLSAYLGNSDVRVRFVGEVGANFRSDMALDHICFTQCAVPKDLIFTNVTSNSLDVSWTPGAAETEWNIEIVPVGTAPTGIGVSTLSNNPYNATGLSPGTNYQVYVQADCGSTTSPFSYVAYIKTSPECGQVVKDFGEDEFYPNNEIDQFTVCPDVVGDIVSLSITEVDLAIGENLSVYDGVSTTTLNTGPITSPQTITSNAVDGCLTVKFTSNVPSINQPSNAEGYEMEVFCSSCPIASDASFTNITANSIDIDWQSNGSTNWEIEIVPSGTTPTGTGIATSSKPYTYSGLTSGTYYDVYIYTDCSGTILQPSIPYLVNTTAVCGDTLYDEGGPVQNYPGGGGANIYTLCPQSPTDKVSFYIDKLVIGSDNMFIFDGNGTANLLGVAAQNSSYIATDASGCLTYQFFDNNLGQNAGFEILTSCVSCTIPLSFTTGVQSPTVIDITWANPGTFDIQLAPISGGTPIMASLSAATSYSATGLTEGETYHVSFSCDGIIYTTIGQFTVPCSLTPIPLNCQGFETMVSGTGNCGEIDRLNECWFNDIGNDENWQVSNGQNINIGNFINYLEDGAAIGDQFIFLGSLNDGGCSNSSGSFYSPIYDISTPSTYPVLEFYYRIQGDNPSSLTIEASMDGGTWSPVYSIFGDQGSDWHSVSIDLEFAANVSNIQFKFFGITDFTNNNNAGGIGVVALDEICIREEPYTCVGTSVVDVCTSHSATVTAGGGWTDINDANGAPVVSINAPVGVDLGTVTVEFLRHSSIKTQSNGNGNSVKLLPRHYHLSSSNYGSNANFPSNVDLRFYFTAQELAMMNQANIGDSGTTSFMAPDIDITHYNGSSEDCTYENNNALPTDTNALIANPIYSAIPFCLEHCLEISVNHFSEFVPHEPDGAALPVELTVFNAVKEEKTSLLTWSTASELNNKGFHIQRSTNDLNFETIAWIDGNGTSSQINDYRYIDESPLMGNNYYRLVQEDFDGSQKNSEVRIVYFKSDFKINVFPNPTQFGKMTSIQIDTEQNQDVNINIFDITGKLIMNIPNHLSIGNNMIEIPSNKLNTGVYIISIEFHGMKEHIKLSVVD